MSKQDFLSLYSVGRAGIFSLLERAALLKNERAGGHPAPLLRGKSLAMIFEKPSTRTRVSFELAITELGGHAVVLSENEMQLGRGETVPDTARVLSRYVHAIMFRTKSHEKLESLAEHASVPVINGLSDMEHPCQLMADLLTLQERGKDITAMTVAWLGDGNNVAHSWITAADLLGFTLRLACPEGFGPDVRYSPKKPNMMLAHNPQDAVRGADVVVTDTWVSMGQSDSAERSAAFQPYQVNEALMRLAKPDAVFLHCLPAHRGEEVTDTVIDGPQSAVWDEAENRLHVQKAVLTHLLKG